MCESHIFAQHPICQGLPGNHQVLPQGAFQSQLAAQVQGWSRHHDQLAKASDKLGQRVKSENLG